MGSSFVSFFTPLTDRLWAAYFTRCDAEREICQAALDRIDDEKGHFVHIVEKRPFNNPGHEKAATRTSFEQLGKAMHDLSRLSRVCICNWRILSIAAEVARLCEQRDAMRVLAAIAQLKPRLEMKTRGMKANEGDAVQF